MIVRATVVEMLFSTLEITWLTPLSLTHPGAMSLHSKEVKSAL